MCDASTAVDSVYMYRVLSSIGHSGEEIREKLEGIFIPRRTNYLPFDHHHHYSLEIGNEE